MNRIEGYMDSELINIWTDGGGEEQREWSGYRDDCRNGLNGG